MVPRLRASPKYGGAGCFLVVWYRSAAGGVPSGAAALIVYLTGGRCCIHVILWFVVCKKQGSLQIPKKTGSHHTERVGLHVLPAYGSRIVPGGQGKIQAHGRLINGSIDHGSEGNRAPCPVKLCPDKRCGLAEIICRDLQAGKNVPDGVISRDGI